MLLLMHIETLKKEKRKSTLPYILGAVIMHFLPWELEGLTPLTQYINGTRAHAHSCMGTPAQHMTILCS